MPKGFTHEKPNENYEYYTPSYIFDALDTEFDMDIASPEEGPVPWIPARRFVTPSEDGLKVDLTGVGLIWCNPPYGKLTYPFLKRMSQHNNGIALVFARTDNAWFHEFCLTAARIYFVQGRINFVDRDGKLPICTNPEAKSYGKKTGSGAASILVGWGKEADEILRMQEIYQLIPGRSVAPLG